MTKQRCATCRFLIVPPDRDGKQRVRRDWSYRCEWPMPELPIAESVTTATTFRRHHMLGTSGKTCPTWEPRNA